MARELEANSEQLHGTQASREGEIMQKLGSPVGVSLRKTMDVTFKMLSTRKPWRVLICEGAGRRLAGSVFDIFTGALCGK